MAGGGGRPVSGGPGMTVAGGGGRLAAGGAGRLDAGGGGRPATDGGTPGRNNGGGGAGGGGQWAVDAIISDAAEGKIVMASMEAEAFGVLINPVLQSDAARGVDSPVSESFQLTSK